MRVGNWSRPSFRDHRKCVEEGVHGIDKIEMSHEELTGIIEQICEAFEQGNLEELNMFFREFCMCLRTTRKFGADAVQLFIDSPAMHVLLSASDGPATVSCESLKHVLVQSPDILKLFVENDGLQLVLSRVQVLENVTVLECLMRILSTGCNISQFCEILRKEQAWIPRYFELFSTFDVSLIRSALIFLPHFLSVYPGQSQKAILLATRVIRKSVSRAIEDNQWFYIYNKLLLFFACALSRLPILMFFAKSGALATTFMLLQTFPRQCLLHCLPVIHACYRRIKQNPELLKCLHNLQRRFAVPCCDVKYVTLAEREWIRPFRDAMASDCEEARNKAISTLRTLIDFDSSLLKDVVEAGIPEQVRRICKGGSFASKVKVLKLVHVVVLRAECDFYRIVFVTSGFISVLRHLLCHESYYHAAKSVLLDLRDLTLLDCSMNSAVQELVEDADRVGFLCQI